MKSYDECLRGLQSVLNRPQYITYVLPLLDAIERENKGSIESGTKRKVDLIVNTIQQKVLTKKVTLSDGEEIISLPVLSEIITTAEKNFR